MGRKMTSSAVLVIQNGYPKLVNIKNQDSITKILDMVPDVLNKFTAPKQEDKISDEDAVTIAFPEEEQAKKE